MKQLIEPMLPIWLVRCCRSSRFVLAKITSDNVPLGSTRLSTTVSKSWQFWKFRDDFVIDGQLDSIVASYDSVSLIFLSSSFFLFFHLQCVLSRLTMSLESTCKLISYPIDLSIELKKFHLMCELFENGAHLKSHSKLAVRRIRTDSAGTWSSIRTVIASAMKVTCRRFCFAKVATKSTGATRPARGRWPTPMGNSSKRIPLETLTPRAKKCMFTRTAAGVAHRSCAATTIWRRAAAWISSFVSRAPFTFWTVIVTRRPNALPTFLRVQVLTCLIRHWTPPRSPRVSIQSCCCRLCRWLHGIPSGSLVYFLCRYFVILWYWCA